MSEEAKSPFFETYYALKGLSPEMDDRLLYICTMKAIGAPCEHPIHYRVGMDGKTNLFEMINEYQIPARSMEKYPWVCGCCGHFKP